MTSQISEEATRKLHENSTTFLRLYMKKGFYLYLNNNKINEN